MSWFAVGGAVVSTGLGMASSNSASKDADKAQQVATNAAGQSYTPINVYGPGGAGVSFGGAGFNGYASGGIAQPGVQPGGQTVGSGSYGFNDSTVGDGTRGQKVYSGSKGTFYSDGFGGRMTKEGLEVVPGTRGKVKRSNIQNANVNAGDLEPLRQNLVGMAGDATAAPGMDASTLALLNNLGMASQVFGDAGLGALGQLQQGSMNAFGQQLGQMGDAGDYSQALRQQGMDMFGSLAGTAEARTAQALDLMRQQAQPEIDRGWARHNDNLFATGRLGTSGGALQTEALARAQMAADRDMQLTAMQEGRDAAGFQMRQAMGLTGEADQMMGNALGRFGDITRLNQSLGDTRFDRTNTLANTNYNRALQMLQNSPQALDLAMRQSQIGLANTALGGIRDINQNALDFANFGQTIMNQQAASRNGQVAQLGANASTAGDAQMGNASMFGSLANMFGGNINQDDLWGSLGGLFNLGGGGGGGNTDITPSGTIDWSTF